jgi:transcriptional regulator with XRE-family HTH domain
MNLRLYAASVTREPQVGSRVGSRPCRPWWYVSAQRRAVWLGPTLADWDMMTGRFAAEDLPHIEDFGAWLRNERERAGLSLETIAARTKVSRPLLVALERNDVSRWPAGIFRRAFVRNYAELVGVDPQLAVALFLQCFPDPPDGGSTNGRRGRAQTRRDDALRLTLAPEALRWQTAAARLGAALTDAMAPVTVALPSGLLGGLPLFWLVLAVVAVLYITVGTLVLGTTPGLWMMQRVGSQPLGARRIVWRRPMNVAEPSPALASDDEAWGHSDRL